MRRFALRMNGHGWSVFDADLNVPIGEVYADILVALSAMEAAERFYGDDHEEYLIERQMAELDKWTADEARMWD